MTVSDQIKDRKSSHGTDVSAQATDGLLDEHRDVEAHKHSISPDAEQEVSVRMKLFSLATYFFLNLALTLSNKAVLGKAQFPWLLTALHTSSTSIGCFIMTSSGLLELTPLTSEENWTLVAFSILFTSNIALSNVSLALVSVPFHQIMRSTCPVITIWIYRACYGRVYPTSTYLTMIPIILGVALATAGDYYCTLAGFLANLLGVILSSIKTVATNRLMTGSLVLSALEILLRMSPLATIQCLLCAYLQGELGQFHATYTHGIVSHSFGIALLVNGVMAFALNISSFQTNKVTGALTMTVCGNVKQVLTIGLGIVLFDVAVGRLNAVGTVITVVGAVWYSKVELDGKRGGDLHGR